MVKTQLLPRSHIEQIRERNVQNIIFKYDCAARVIQNAWKNYKAREDQRKDEIMNILLREMAAIHIQDWWRNVRENK